MDKVKPFSISRRLFMYVYQKVRSNKGTRGTDGMSLEDLDKDYKNQFYKLWNRMSSGSYMRPTVRLVEIPKRGGGLRRISIGAVIDRIGQTVGRGLLEPDIARQINPMLTGRIYYYSKFYATKLKASQRLVNVKVAKWERRKYKGLRPSMMKAMRWLQRVSVRSPNLFAHWLLLDLRSTAG